MKSCTNCHIEFDDTFVFCPKCGRNLQENVKLNFCPYCGNMIETNSDFCPFCGKPLNEQVSLQEISFDKSSIDSSNSIGSSDSSSCRNSFVKSKVKVTVNDSIIICDHVKFVDHN